MKKPIPVYKQSAEAVGGIYIAEMKIKDSAAYQDRSGAHRDDFYIFFVLATGSVKMKCDLSEVTIHPMSIGLVKPFQVHATVDISEHTSGYFISVAPFLIPDPCAHVFQQLTN